MKAVSLNSLYFAANVSAGSISNCCLIKEYGKIRSMLGHPECVLDKLVGY